jgi:hypothetical protein
MGIISGVVYPANGDRIKAENYNSILQAILAQVNGNLDDSNIASLSGTKITAGTIPFSALNTAAAASLAQGWNTLSVNPSAVGYLGNRSHILTFAGVDVTDRLAPGTRIRTTRTVAAPNQSTSLNGSTQFYSKTTPNGMTFTDDFVVSAWIKLSSYSAGDMNIVTRYNGTSGWKLTLSPTGQVYFLGVNGGAANQSYVASYQSVPLNKWVHITAQLDMSSFTASTTTSYVMFDGVDVPAFVQRGGTNPTALVQAGNLEIGSTNGGLLPFPGKIAQLAIYNNKVTQATIQASISQTLVGTETSLISAYSFNNTINDLNVTNANNLTASGSAVATNADSPYGTQASGLISTTLDYGIVQSATFSTNSTVIVQVPEGCTIPSSGGISSTSYSGLKAPYGFPVARRKWTIQATIMSTQAGSIAGLNTWVATQLRLSIPTGEWIRGYQVSIDQNSSVSGTRRYNVTLSDSAPINGTYTTELDVYIEIPGTTDGIGYPSRQSPYSTNTMAVNTFYITIRSATGVETYQVSAISNSSTIYAENAYL